MGSGRMRRAPALRGSDTASVGCGAADGMPDDGAVTAAAVAATAAAAAIASPDSFEAMGAAAAPFLTLG